MIQKCFEGITIGKLILTDVVVIEAKLFEIVAFDTVQQLRHATKAAHCKFRTVTVKRLCLILAIEKISTETNIATHVMLIVEANHLHVVLGNVRPSENSFSI